MIRENKKILAFNYFGGKYQYLEELYAQFPEHLHFVDLMCGSMGVTLNKIPSQMDTANDLDGDVINFFKVLREQPEELYRSLYLTPAGRQEYLSCFPINGGGSDLERARRFFVRCKLSFQGSGLKQHTGFNACVATAEKSMSKNVTKFLTSIEKLSEVVKRLRTIQIENLDYKTCLIKYDRPGTFFYVDPPYELRKRNYKKWYSVEFVDDQAHKDLAAALSNIQGMAMVSGYESELYMDLYKDWRFMKLRPRGHSMSIEPKQECIWMNY